MKRSLSLCIMAAALISAASFQYSPYTSEVSAAGLSEVFINEACSQNKSNLTDSYGKHADWIELYNSGSSAADISGYGLSDKADEPFRYTFPSGTSIPAGGYLVVFASENESSGSELHTGFSLSKNGETLILTSPDGSSQEVTIPTLGEDVTYGRTPDGSSTFEIMSPTPGQKNISVVSAPEFSQPSGFYGNSFALTLSAPSGTSVYYTTDGSNPATSSTAMLYSGPLTVNDRTNEPNLYCEKYTEDESDHAISRGTGYQKPTFSVDKATVIRAAAKNSDGQFSTVTDRTYFITTGNLAQYKNTTVVSMVTDPENLFDPDRGIYVTGTQYTQWKSGSSYSPRKSVWDTDNICNFFSKGMDWERPASITIFDKGETEVEQNMGIRIKGASTRNTAQKSFNIFARSEYGASKINTPVLPDNYSVKGKLIDKYDSLSIRAIGEENRLHDGFAQRLLADRTNLTTQNMKPCVLFLNGEYWGLYEITEKLSDYFIESNYGIDKNDVAMIKSNEPEEGGQEECDSFITFAKTYSEKDLTNDTNYKAVCDFIDIDSMIEHYAAGLYLNTYDWPNRNYGAWRSTGEAIEGNPYSDGKWRFMTYDLDYSMGATYENFGGVEGFAYNSFTHMEKGKKDCPTNLFIQLLKNPEFKAKFAAVYCDYANAVMTPERIQPMLDHYSQNYTDLLAGTKLRWWGSQGGNVSGLLSWYKSEYQTKELPKLKTFFNQRSAYAIDHMKKYLGLNGQMQEITVTAGNGGKVLVSSLTAENGKMTAKYLSDSPVTLTAIPDENHEFSGWGGDITGTERTITVTLSKAMSITADFTEASAPAKISGDINSDGKVNADDALLLRKYLLGISSPSDIMNADMDSDGRISIADFCLLKEAVLR